MVASDWDYMAHGLYNSRPIYHYTEEQERAYWQDFTTHLTWISQTCPPLVC
jgi:hypothetical protein